MLLLQSHQKNPVRDNAIRICVIERSSLILNSEDFSELQQQPSFIKMLETGVLTVGMHSRGLFELTASHYLGAANLENNWTIEVTEKFTGTLRGLFDVLSNARYKFTNTLTSGHVDGSVLAHIANTYLSAVEKYVSHGRMQAYQQKSISTKRPSGRLDIRGTIRHVSRGMASTAQVTAFQLTPDILANQIFAYCLVEIEVLAFKNATMHSLLYRVRTLFLLFGDVQYLGLVRLSRTARAEKINRCIEQRAIGQEMRSALELAFPLFVGGGLFGVTADDFRLQSLFVDMEFLFEQSVLKAFQRATNFLSTSGKSSRVRVFPKGSRRFRCEPDIVLSIKAGDMLAVGDVKYKTLEKSGVANSDVYQLLAHAGAFGVEKAFLIYPGEGFSHKTFGSTHDGTYVDIFTVRPGYLLLDVAMVADHILGS